MITDEAASLAAWEARAAATRSIHDATLTVRPDELTGFPAAGSTLATTAHPARSGCPPTSRSLDDELSTTGPWPSRYRLLGPLGEGGMGTVLLAQQTELDREVAIKVVKQGDHQERADAFRSEVRITGLLDHPGVIPVHDAGSDFYVMKRIRGQTLEELLDVGMALDRAIDVLLRVCDAVAFAHDKGIIHRDIKPSNIMVGPFGETLLLDWGLAISVDADRRRDGPTIPALADLSWAGGGTPAYAAPEMVAGDRAALGYASDVFLLAATAYRCVAGHPPYGHDGARGALRAALRCAWHPLAERAPEAPARLITVIERGLDANPAQRGTVSDFAEGLRDWQHHMGASAEARDAMARGQAAAEAATAATDTVAAYDGWQRAVAAFEQARTLDPDLHSAVEARHRARAAYAQRALDAGDLALARAIIEREDADQRTAPLAAARAAVGSAVARRARIQRRARQFALATAALLVVALGLAVYEGWRARAELGREGALRAAADERSAAVRHLAHSVIEDLDAALADLGPTAPLRRRLALNALGYLDQLATEDADQDLASELANGFHRIANLLAAEPAADPATDQACRTSFDRAAALAQAAGEQDWSQRIIADREVFEARRSAMASSPIGD